MFARLDVTGPDAGTFLQGQLTQNVQSASEQHAPLAAWCDPKGRVLATMRLEKLADGLGLILPGDAVAAVAEGLARYRLRSRVRIEPAANDWLARAYANAADLDVIRQRGLAPATRRDACCQRDGLTAVSLNDDGSVLEVYGTRAALDALSLATPLADADWHVARIAAGIADIVPASSGRYTPHMLNLDRLGAISFDKGCYTGQEIIARTQHLGQARRRLVHFVAGTPLAIGASVTHEGTGVGTVVAAAGRDALVLLPLELAGESLEAGGTALSRAASA